MNAQMIILLTVMYKYLDILVCKKKLADESPKIGIEQVKSDNSNAQTRQRLSSVSNALILPSK